MLAWTFVIFSCLLHAVIALPFPVSRNVTCAEELDSAGHVINLKCEGHVYNLKQSVSIDSKKKSDNDSGAEAVPVYQAAIFRTFRAAEPDKLLNGSYNQLEGMLSHYKDDPRVAFVVHGFKTEHLERFLKIKDALFNITDIAKRPDVVTIVDWRLMAKFKTSDIFAGYKKAARNAELVGQEIAHALYLLSVHRKLNLDKVHLIGFSLGAQVVGMAGRKAVMAYSLAKVGRITGLDPAGPRFEDFTGHLNRDDAHFVDIIHTNAGNSWFTLKMGMSKSVGHVDFYPNGGSKQPGCTRSFKDISCSHNMAVKLFEASISAADQCKFQAMKCPKWADYENGDMTKCTQELVPMGFYSNTVNSQGTFYLKTTAQYPYC